MTNNNWNFCRNILVFRPDNMGDLLMSSPAIRALKESFDAKITVLTSSMAAGIARMIPEIDEIIQFDLPWVKAKDSFNNDSFLAIVEIIKQRHFDAAVIFTVYSQNSLPTAMLAFLAGIPRRLAYCRENPYELLTDWVPDNEPYTLIRHQVRRDLELVKKIGAKTSNENLSLSNDESLLDALVIKLKKSGVNLNQPLLILHPGVSELKREYPIDLWIETGKQLAKEYQLLITGAGSEGKLAALIQNGIGSNSFSLAGELSLKEFALLVSRVSLVISVNTGTIHLAAACKTPVIVLYALTNPQHSPWRVKGKVLTFDVEENLTSRNEVIKYVSKMYASENKRMVEPEEIIDAVKEVLSGKAGEIPEIIDPVLPVPGQFFEKQF